MSNLCKQTFWLACNRNGRSSLSVGERRSENANVNARFAVVSCSIIPAGPSSPHHRLACSGLAGDLREWPSPGDVELFAAREAGPLPTSEATAASRAVRAKSSLIRSYADWWSVVDRPA
jgi:hypothetical protein